ncbi:LRRC29.2 family protein [Megaselia abdita]
MSNWEYLPPQFFKVILENMSLRTCLDCMTVCKSWNQNLKVLLQNMTEIQTINFSDFDAEILVRIVPSIRSIKITLDKSDNTKFTKLGFSKIWNLDQLQSLGIDFSKRKFKNPKWFSYFTSMINFKLEVFRIANVEVECNFLRVLASRAPNLQKLSLISIPNIINITRGFQHLAVDFELLKHIEIVNLSSFEDFELNYMFPIPSFKNLNSFYFDNASFPYFFFKMFKAPFLKIVVFKSCYTICDKDMEDFTKRCPNIEEFKMMNRYQCPNFTDSAVEILSLNLKNLKVVEFDCRGTTLSYRSIRFLLKNTTKLELAVFNNIEGFETAEEIEGFLAKASKIRYPFLRIEKIKIEDPNTSFFIEAEYELRSENLKVIVRSIICDVMNKPPSINGSFIMDLEETPEINEIMSVDNMNVDELSKSNLEYTNEEEFQYQKALARRIDFLTAFDEPNEFDNIVTNLPTEFFKMFSFRDLKVLMLVCKSWYSKIEESFQKKTWLNCSKVTKTDLFHLNKSGRVYDKLLIDKDSLQIISILCILDKSKVTSILFDEFPKVDEILYEFPGVQTLQFQNICENSTIKGKDITLKIQTLKSLSYQTIKTIENIKPLELLIKNNPGLEELKLVLPNTPIDLSFLSTSQSLKKFTLHQPKWNQWLVVLNPSVKYVNIHFVNNQVRYPNICQLLSSFKDLEEIQINFFNKKRFDTLWERNSVRKIGLYCVNNPHTFWRSCPERKENMTSLTLFSKVVTEKFMLMIHESMPNLYFISISCENPSNIQTTFFYEVVSKLKKLSTLELSNFVITFPGKSKIPPTPPFLNLNKLFFQGCQFRNYFLRILNAPNLSDLTIMLCGRTDFETVRILSYRFPKVKKLNVCNISSETFFNIYDEMKFLESFKGTVVLDSGTSNVLGKIFEISKRIRFLDILLIGRCKLGFFIKVLEIALRGGDFNFDADYNVFCIYNEVREIRLKYLVKT